MSKRSKFIAKRVTFVQEEIKNVATLLLNEEITVRENKELQKQKYNLERKLDKLRGECWHPNAYIDKTWYDCDGQNISWVCPDCGKSDYRCEGYFERTAIDTSDLKVSEYELKTISQWCEELNIKILSEDAFEFDDPLLNERLFTKKEFCRCLKNCPIKEEDYEYETWEEYDDEELNDWGGSKEMV